MHPFRPVSCLLALIATLTTLIVAIPAFATPGGTDLIVKTHIPNARNEANAVIVQPDGKYLTAGYARFGTLQFTVTRYNADGSIDTAFADNGTLFEPIGSGDSIATGVALQADGKIVVAGYVTTNVDKFAIARFDSAGHLDTSFGGGGAATPVGSGNARGNAIAVQGDGKILVAGFAISGGHKVFAIARYTTGAALDGTFGSGGIVLTPIGGGDAEALSMVVQGDGKIVVGGTAAGAGSVARYNPNGTLDTTFGGTGIMTPSGFGFAYSLAMQADGKIVVGGTASTNVQFIVGRLDSNGTMDGTFGSGGTVLASFSNGGSARGVIVQADGKIVAGGQAQTQAGTATGIMRLTSTGAFDATFGSGGVVLLNVTGDDLIHAMALTGDGRYVLAGSMFPPTMATIPGDELIERFTSAGALDTTFNGSGFREADLGSSPAFAKGSAIQSDGKIVVAGYVEYEQSTLPDTLVLARYNADGTLDAGFGTGGLVLPAGTTRANAVAIQGDGKIVTAGFNRTSGTGQTVFQVVRFNTNGSLDTSFNGSGIVTEAINAVDDEATSIAIQGDGRIVVGGMTKPGSFYDSAFMRFLPTGALDTGFGSSGIATVAMSTGSDHVSSIALQADGKIVGAGSAAVTGGNDAFGVLRLMPNGTIDGTFGTGGFTTTSVGSILSDGFAVAVQSDAKIVVGGLTFNGSTDDFAVVRYNADGTLDATFGTGGKTTTDMGNHNRIFALQLLGDGKIAVAGEWAGAFAAGLYTTSGALDTTFGANGTVFLPVNFNAGADHAWSLSIQADGKWVLAGDGSGLFAWARIFGEGGTVTKANPTVGIASSANPSNAGQSVTFTATVSGSAGTPTGTVTFLDGSTAICSSVALSGGAATCATSSLTGGTHSISATYSGDASYNGATSSPLSQTVNATKANASVSLASSANPSNTGQGVTFTATVSGSAGTPTGSATFLDGSATICSSVALSAGTAACATSSLAAGSHAITAQYSGDAGYNGASSGTITQTVQSSTSAAVNVALASNGAMVSASSTNASYNLAAVINGDRTGANITANAWVDDTRDVFPDWVRIDFASAQTIDHVVVYSVQDNYTAPVEPTDTLTFTSFGLTAFDVQGWNGSAWVTLGSVTGNNLVKRTVSFPAATVSAIRVMVNNALLHYSRIVEIEAWSATSAPPPPSSVNVALASNGGVASASSTNASYTLAAVNNGDRTGANLTANVWVDDTRDMFPDSVEIAFPAAHAIDHVVVYSVQDNYTAPVEPTDTMTFSSFGVTAFDVQGWNGSSWVTLGSVTGNNLVKRTVSFPAATVSAIRVMVNNALLHYSRVVEIEAWTASSAAPASGTNFALASNGGVASASSTNASYTLAAVNNGDRTGANLTANVWVDDTRDMFPDSVEIDFPAAHAIDHVVVYSVQDNYTAPVEPTDTMTFSSFGVTAFDVQGWNGSSWVTLGSVTGNNLVKRTVSFPAASISRVRVIVNNALLHYSRIVEIEAWGS